MADCESKSCRQPAFQVRNMEEEDIPGALRVWTETGLIEGSHTVQTWFIIDPKGFFVAVDDDTGEVLGTCAGILLHDDLAFVGLYAVLERCRGLGIGRCIWEAVMNRLGDRNVGLNSVPEHLHTYRDLAGFSIVTPWTAVLYEGTTLTPEQLTENVEDVQILPYSSDLLDKIVDFDTSVHGFRREHILQTYMKEEDSLNVIALRTSSGVVCGYGGIRGNVQPTALVGPVYAEDTKVAESICRRLVEDFPAAGEQGVTMAVISSNPDSLVLAEKLGLNKQMHLPRCYTREIVEAEFPKVYAHLALNFSTF